MSASDELALSNFQSGEWMLNPDTGVIYKRITGTLVDGYRIIGAGQHNGQRKKLGIMYHRAVWIGANMCIPPAGLQIDHIDGDKTNNTPQNLKPATDTENKNNPNTKWKRYGEGNPNAKLTQTQVMDILVILKTAERLPTIQRRRIISDLAEKYKVSGRTIERIESGKNWQAVKYIVEITGATA